MNTTTLQQYRGYIFDLDGTLLDTILDLTNSVNYALRTFRMPEHTCDEVRGFVGNGVRLLIERAVPAGTKDGITIQVFEAFREHYLQHSIDNTKPYSGILETLNILKQRGCKIAIVSNKLQPAVTELCDRFFSDCADVAIGEKIGIARKPAPDMVIEAMRQLNLSSQDSVYIGDSDVDIQTARNASLPCISVDWGFRDSKFLTTYGATHIITSPQELL